MTLAALAQAYPGWTRTELEATTAKDANFYMSIRAMLAERIGTRG